MSQIESSPPMVRACTVISVVAEIEEIEPVPVLERSSAYHVQNE